MGALAFREIWAVDFEYRSDGDPPDVHCMAAVEVRTGREIVLWKDQLGPEPPFSTGEDALFVAYYASAEMGCFLSLGWSPPAHILDLYAEYRNLGNGKALPFGGKLTGLAQHKGLHHAFTSEKKDLQALGMRGGPYTEQEKRDLLEYCLEDARITAQIVPRFLPDILERNGHPLRTNLLHALVRGKYTIAAARMERAGVPVDGPMLERLKASWGGIQDRLIDEINPLYEVYEDGHLRKHLLAGYIERRGFRWPRTATGLYSTSNDTFRDMAKVYPEVGPLKELLSTLGQVRLADLSVGSDGRNRALLGVFGARTGRNAPKAGRFVFGPATWLRGLIVPPPGYALAYVDWSAQEIGIAAALSGDAALLQDYLTDPYLGFAKRIGAAPPDATKRTHGEIRDAMKTVVLGVGYGMGVGTMAARLERDMDETAHLLAKHRRTYARFWRWIDGAIDRGQLRGDLETRLGWTRDVTRDKPTAIQNFPMQANAADMMRLASIYATEAGLEVLAPVHDAFLIMAPERWIKRTAAELQKHMKRASADLLDGFELRSSASFVKGGKRYMDARGILLWRKVMRLLREVETERGIRRASNA